WNPSSRPTGEFLGFGPNRIHLRKTGQKQATWEPFDQIESLVDSSGHKLSMQTIQGASDRLMVQVVASLEQGKTRRNVDLLDPQFVEIAFGGPNRAFRTTGFILGLATDATIVVSVIGITEEQAAECPSQPAYGLEVAPLPGDESPSIYRLPQASGLGR